MHEEFGMTNVEAIHDSATPVDISIRMPVGETTGGDPRAFSLQKTITNVATNVAGSWIWLAVVCR
jgi:hypothetical protein